MTAPLRSTSPAGLDAGDLRFVREVLRQDAGIVVEDDKDYFIEMRLAGLSAEIGHVGLPALVEGVRVADRFSTLRKRLVEALTISETSFFRDVHPFDALREVVLPALADARGRRPLRVWSAACASGQEPWSVALGTLEHLPAIAPRLRVLATDLSSAAIERASEGRYHQNDVNRGLPIRHLVRFFLKEGDAWVLRDEPRALVEFAELNLAATWPIMPAMDVVLMRNVLMYLDEEIRRRVLRRVSGVLAPDGVLIVGAGEGGIVDGSDFDAETIGRSVVFRPRGAAGFGGVS